MGPVAPTPFTFEKVKLARMFPEGINRCARTLVKWTKLLSPRSGPHLEKSEDDISTPRTGSTPTQLSGTDTTQVLLLPDGILHLADGSLRLHFQRAFEVLRCKQRALCKEPRCSSWGRVEPLCWTTMLALSFAFPWGFLNTAAIRAGLQRKVKRRPPVIVDWL